MNGAYPSILAIRILGIFRRVAVNIGVNAAGARKPIPGLGLGIRGVTASIGCVWVGVQDVMTDFGDLDTSNCDVAMRVRNTDVDIRDICADTHCRFRLEAGLEGRQWSERNQRTHIKDAANPINVLRPSSDSLSVILRVEMSRENVSFTPFDDVSLDPDHSPTMIEDSVSKSPGASTTG